MSGGVRNGIGILTVFAKLLYFIAFYVVVCVVNGGTRNLHCSNDITNAVSVAVSTDK
ncbi:hypothetical protein WN55_03337 [Dufourea novaeangliae]|uniref:Uncharacterized protein n=1 Tax=Dufourea novaeangliae TaxID=178035 RepID=A0A154PM92_DUFNO|nr:hypothetical protein WN55_03337 [Dufourea novaeangliae]